MNPNNFFFPFNNPISKKEDIKHTTGEKAIRKVPGNIENLKNTVRMLKIYSTLKIIIGKTLTSTAKKISFKTNFNIFSEFSIYSCFLLRNSSTQATTDLAKTSSTCS